jgi:UPF0755 protein
VRTVWSLLVVVALAIAALGVVAWKWYREPLPLPAMPFVFEVRPKSTLGAVARELSDAGVIAHPMVLTALARYRRVDRSIKAGSYEIERGITLPRLLAKLTQGDVMQSAVTLVEGATFAELRRTLAATREIAPTLLDLPDPELLARLGIAHASPEGLFFPDTYFFAIGSPDAALLKRAHRALDERLAAGWDKRAPGLPFASPYEALILASIVEKETGRAADRPLIASVLVNRLKKGMRLQTDPTVIYGMGPKFDGNLRKRDLETDTPYNTYTRDGLPPTPIAQPSQASLDAVLNPPDTSYLYFVARGDGSSEFSSSLADHNRAVSKYQKGGR